MKECKLDDKYYSLLKTVKLDELEGKITFYDDDKKIQTSDFELLLILVTEEFCRSGMNKYQEPIERGRDLESLYDLLMFDSCDLS